MVETTPRNVHSQYHAAPAAPANAAAKPASTLPVSHVISADAPPAKATGTKIQAGSRQLRRELSISV
jgi:hypothetical protein